MTKRFLLSSWIIALSIGVGAACDGGGGSSDGSTSWYSECRSTEDCKEGLSCICGICSKGCAAAADCAGAARPTTCLRLARGAGESCVASLGTTGAICLPACDRNGRCAPGLRCDASVCVPLGVADPDGGVVPSGAGGRGGSGGMNEGGGGSGAVSDAGGAASSMDACGDGKATGLEPCDGADLRGAGCSDFGFEEGELRCYPNECYFDLGGCTSGATAIAACGNGKIDSGEACDGTDLAGRRCEDLGGISGTLSCVACSLVTTGCKPPVCGDGIAGNGEACDGADLRGLTCAKLGYPSGTLACKKDACELDDSNCERCGDGLIEDGEACDGSMLWQTTCRSLGFSGGYLACAEGCKLDAHACARCGNGMIEGGENCDGSALGGATCASLGLPAGALKCSSSCLFDVSACGSSAPKCGDGVAEPGEECDRKDLTGLDCGAFGKDGGMLGCSATCRFDTTGCVEPPPADPCRDCRTERCAPQLDACKANPYCVSVLDCVARCATSSPDDQCWFACGDLLPNPTPLMALDVLPTALSAFACTTSGCVSVCGEGL